MSDVASDFSRARDVADAPATFIFLQPAVLALQMFGQLQIESLRFVRARVEKDFEHLRRCAACTSAAALAVAACDFAADATADYARESLRLIAFGAEEFERCASAVI